MEQSFSEAEKPRISAVFIDHPLADVTLRSLDDIYFRVISSFLAYSSPVFAGMFSVPVPAQSSSQSQDEIKDGHRVVPLTETARVLEVTLLLCYPESIDMGTSFSWTLGESMAVLQAVTKYDMHLARAKARTLLIKSGWLTIDPLQTYALACKYKVLPEAKLAAAYVLFIQGFHTRP